MPTPPTASNLPANPGESRTMRAARLHGPRDLRLDNVPRPGEPGAAQVRLRVTAVGVCGSDLHMYQDARIGDTVIEQPLTLGHEFAGVIEALGEDARYGEGKPLRSGQRVAVDPAQPCGRCELCHAGHPNLCPDHLFTGVAPTPGALCEQMIVPASTCFALPQAIDDEQAALLEPLGVALHAIDLAHLKVGHDVAVIGAGPIGLLCARVAKLSGAAQVLVADRLPWRLALAEQWGGEAVEVTAGGASAAEVIRQRTGGRGVDVALEAAWSDEASVRDAVDALRPGGRLVIVGISDDDRLTFQHSAVRRKGLTIALCRRMKHTYPRAIRLALSGQVALSAMISHRYALEESAAAMEAALGYQDGVVKVMVSVA